VDIDDDWLQARSEGESNPFGFHQTDVVRYRLTLSMTGTGACRLEKSILGRYVFSAVNMESGTGEDLML
jgi:hypothetical protein